MITVEFTVSLMYDTDTGSHPIVDFHFNNCKIKNMKNSLIPDLPKEDLHRKLDFSVIFLIQATSAGKK